MSNMMLNKTPSETVVRYMDFGPKMGSGITLASVTSVTASPSDGVLLITLPALTPGSTTKAQATFSGGTSGTTYDIQFTVVDSEGETLQECGPLSVLAC